MADYKFVAADGPNLLGELQALGKSLTLRLRGTSSAVFDINGEHPTAELILPLQRDIVVYRDDEPVFRGVIGTTRHTVQRDSHYISVTVLDYRAFFRRRLFTTPLSFTGARDDEIALQLLDAIQQEGSMGITPGQIAAGPERDFEVEVGTSLAAALNSLSNLDGGFEWDITPDLKLDIFRQRGESRGRVLDYGGAAAAVELRFNPGEFANSVVFTGASSTSPVVVADVPPDERRYDLLDSDLNLNNQPLLEAAAELALERARAEFRSFRIEMRQTDQLQAWRGLSDVGLGDMVTVAVRSGPLDLSELQRVQTISIDVTEDGREDVAFETDVSEGRFDQRLNAINDRLATVERTV